MMTLSAIRRFAAAAVLIAAVALTAATLPHRHDHAAANPHPGKSCVACRLDQAFAAVTPTVAVSPVPYPVVEPLAPAQPLRLAEGWPRGTPASRAPPLAS